MFHSVVFQRDDAEQFQTEQRESRDSGGALGIGIKHEEPTRSESCDFAVAVKNLIPNRPVNRLVSVRMRQETDGDKGH